MAEYTSITMEEAKESFQAPGDYLIVDVRRADEYAEGHIPGAINIANEDIVELQVNKSKAIGKYHMMQAENPVWICSFDFREGAADEAQ